MAIYAIGDIQGCFSALENLIGQIRFDPTKDTLWFVGDLVNRGPDSLAVLRWVKALGLSAIVVLGNHDLHLLAAAEGLRPVRKGRYIPRCACSAGSRGAAQLASAPAASSIAKKIRSCSRRPIACNGQWTEAADAGAERSSGVFRSPDYKTLLQQMYGSSPAQWSPDLTGMVTLQGDYQCAYPSALLYPRRADGLKTNRPARDRPSRVFRHGSHCRTGRSSEAVIVSGHWAALGLRVADNLLALDSGCVWGGSLTAVRLEDRKVYQVACGRRVKRH